MKWYLWRQNNSGGSYERPGINVIIEAPDIHSAVKQFVDNYYTTLSDCECCGPRWDTEPDEVADSISSIMEKVYSFHLIPPYSRSRYNNIPVICIKRNDGVTLTLNWKFGNE